MAVGDEMQNGIAVPGRVSIFDTEYPLDRSDWFQVFSACLGKVTAIQTACGEQVVKNQDWNVDFPAGTLSFGADVYPVQFLGSEASSDQTWMWGWNNLNGFGEGLLKLANEMKSVGEAWNLEPFRTDCFSLDDTYNGRNLAIAACGITKDPYCCYRGPHAGGAVLLAFSGAPDSVFAPVDEARFVSTVMECIQRTAVEQRIFVESFLLWNGTGYDREGDGIVAHFSNDLLISFEKPGKAWRISSIKSV